MALFIRGQWICGYCGTPYVDQTKADQCRESHDLIYVPLTKTDLNRLLNFIFTKDEALLSRELMDTLQRYLRGNESEK